MRISSSRNSRVFETAIRLLIRQTEFVHIGTATEPITVWMHIALLGQNEAIEESEKMIENMQDATEWSLDSSRSYFIPQ